MATEGAQLKDPGSPLKAISRELATRRMQLMEIRIAGREDDRLGAEIARLAADLRRASLRSPVHLRGLVT